MAHFPFRRFAAGGHVPIRLCVSLILARVSAECFVPRRALAIASMIHRGRGLPRLASAIFRARAGSLALTASAK